MINKPVSTNIITGFLGVGKTSLIKALLAQKPKDEVWAVLINEFGEVGLDSHLLGAGAPKVVIKEVAGGCLCCAAGLPIQVAINQLLAKAKPDRLIIEPTGLGHTDQILTLLQSEYYQQVISLDSTLCLVDARKVSVTAYRENELFIKQLQCSDVILANKSTEYSSEKFEDLQAFLLLIGADKAILLQDSFLPDSNIKNADITCAGTSNSELTTPMSVVSNSIPKEAALFSDLLLQSITRCLTQKIKAVKSPNKASRTIIQAPRLLGGNKFNLFSSIGFSSDNGQDAEQAYDQDFNKQGFICKSQIRDGYLSVGWIFEPSLSFDFDRLVAFVTSLKPHVLRLKAVMITLEGIAGFNLIDEALSIFELDDCLDSRLEIITSMDVDDKTTNKADEHQTEKIRSTELAQKWQTALLSCLAPRL
jgi:hypothetical protein